MRSGWQPCYLSNPLTASDLDHYNNHTREERIDNRVRAVNIYRTLSSFFEQMRKYWCSYEERTFTYTLYGVFYQCERGYTRIRGETWMMMTCI